MGLRSEYAQKYIDCLAQREAQLVALLCRMGFPQQVAVDATQEAIFVAYMVIAAQTVESLSDRWKWLIGVALHKGRDICRSHWYGRLSLDENALVAGPFGKEDEPVAGLQPVWEAFDCLPRNLQDLVAYVCLSGHTYAEAAERFEIGLGVVSARLCRAKRQLRASVSAYSEFQRARRPTHR